MEIFSRNKKVKLTFSEQLHLHDKTPNPIKTKEVKELPKIKTKDNKVVNIKVKEIKEIKVKHEKIIDIKKAKKKLEVKTQKSKSSKLKKETKKSYAIERKKTLKLIEDWKDVMYQTKTMTQDNKTFTFMNIQYETFGFKANLFCPIGLTFMMLDTIRDKIEDGLHCIFIYNKERLDNHMEVRIVVELSMDKRFAPPETKPYEIYIGDRFDGTPIIVDLNKWCHLLLSGTTGGGKSKLLDCALATQVHNHVPKDLWLFLIQLDKCDLLLYKDAEICKGFADDIDKAIVILEYLMEQNKKRTALVATVKQKGLGGNITEYNAIHPENSQTTIWIVLDEMASLSANASDRKETKEKKAIANDLLQAVAQYGRSNNIFLISCIQRPTAVLLNSFIKSMSNLKISFRASNSKSSEVSMDDSSIALDLPMRVAVYKLLSFDFLQTPFIDDPLIMKYIKSSLNPSHKNIFGITKWSKRLYELQGNQEKNNDKSKGKKDASPSSDTGNEDISKEMNMKRQLEDILQKEKDISLREEELNKQTKMFNQNKINVEAEAVKEQRHQLLLSELLEQQHQQKLDQILLQQQELRELEKQPKKANQLQQVKKHQQTQYSTTYDKLKATKIIDNSYIDKKDFNKIIEKNTSKIKGYIPYVPTSEAGKEKI